jgi:UDP-2,4-diacetamido-2,4,6-trideoxy-beta-L-altropyranose hydrolase
MGHGHVVRCFALATMLKNDFEIKFFSRELPNTILAEMIYSGFNCNIINGEDEFLSQLTSQTIAVLDGYQFSNSYQKQVKATGSKLVCIDDLHRNEFVSDLIINHAPGVKLEDYKVQPYTQLAIGPDYALLRPAFLEQAKKQRKIDKIETVLICYGGSDYKNLTAKTLRLLSGLSSLKKINVITGSAFNCTDSIDLLMRKDKRISHYISADEHLLLSIMMDSDLAIVPASGILFEALAAGCYALTGYYVENQKVISEGFKDFRSTNDSNNLFLSLDIPLRDFYIINAVATKKKIIDGLSGVRLIQKFKSLHN